MPRTVLWHWNTHCRHDPQSRVMHPKEQQQTRIGLLSDQNVFVQWTTDKLMMASKWYSYRWYGSDNRLYRLWRCASVGTHDHCSFFLL
jgi:hypothetical protein